MSEINMNQIESKETEANQIKNNENELENSEYLKNYLSSCHLCPRNCGVNRLEGETGYCGTDAQVRAARAALHMWEEPCISGTEGSGAVFFSGCPLQCVFCQNHDIALAKAGSVISIERLADIFLELQGQKANNINLVTPTHYVPQIVCALKLAKSRGLSIPIVYNTGSYEKAETLKMLEGLIDIYLPDCKYADAELAKELSNAPDYFETAISAIREMVRQTGEPVFDERGMMQRGTIVRHLILPEHTRDSKQVIQKLYETFGDSIYISMMNQYTPMYQEQTKDTIPMENRFLLKHPELNRKITKREYEKVIDYALDLGLVNGFTQEGKTASESFIPQFDGEGIEQRIGV